nr:hypothetical protein [uncultured Duganella sp.]
MKKFLLALLLLSVTGFVWSAEKTLCEAEEKLVWSCHASKKTYSVCAAPNLSRDVGYMQYRVGSVGKLEFIFPVTRVHPLTRFKFDMGPHGGSLNFKNAGFDYSIAQDARGLPLIFVDKDGKQMAYLKCKDSTGDLLENSTLELFKEVGIFE